MHTVNYDNIIESDYSDSIIEIGPSDNLDDTKWNNNHAYYVKWLNMENVGTALDRVLDS